MKNVIEKVSDGLKLDRSNWKLVKFGEVAIQQKEAVDRENTNLTRYVKGEHMYSEDLHLREWGELTDEYLGPAFIRKFNEGDILYGSRRTYLRKVVIAPFDGITSNTTFVIKANEKKIDKRLLPFVMLSEGFAQHSIRNSKGSVNPYVNWKDLAGYEFMLPPIAQQAELADLLWAKDDAIEKVISVELKTSSFQKSYFAKFKLASQECSKHKIKDLMSFNYGKPLKESDRIEGDFPVVTSSGVQGTHNAYVVEGPGIVIGRKGNVGQVTWIDDNYWPTDTAYYISVNPEYRNIPLKMFFYMLQGVDFKKLSIATAVPGLNRDDALAATIYLPNKDSIMDILSDIELINKQLSNVENKLESSKNLLKNLINQVF